MAITPREWIKHSLGLGGIVHHWTNFVHETLFPPVCVLCGGRGEGLDLCPGCRADLPWTETVCLRCGLPLSVLFPVSNLCGRCQQRPPSYDRMFAAFSYEPPVDHLIVNLKFYGHLAHARLLGELLADYLTAREAPLPELILPVPLHPTRLRARGYNQALELARPVARRLGLSIAPTLCRRVRATAAQSLIGAKMRQSNVHGAFAVAGRERIAGRRVAIFDDVVTTGNTVEAFAQVLRQAEAREIEVWTVARTGEIHP
ncbi:competence protein ComFC [Gammaproteobacteria bacterium]